MPRREFLSLCAAVATVLGLRPEGVREALADPARLRLPVLWLHLAECTGCTESLLRSTSPYFDDLILNSISLDYHETLMVDAGQGAEKLRAQVLEKYAGEFLCIVEGSIPTADNGIYGTIGGKSMYGIAAEVLPKAKSIIAIGSCSCDGGVAAAAPSPCGARSVTDSFPDLRVPIVKCPGCPPNPVNFVAIIVDYLLKGTVPELDSMGRPTFAYGKTVHQLCSLLGTPDCLQSRGCRGIATFGNCPKVKFNEGTSYCQQAGHVCIGCSEAGFWDEGALWDASFWTNYDVEVDPAKAGITYRGDPEGIGAAGTTEPDGGAGGDGSHASASGGASGNGGTRVNGGGGGSEDSPSSPAAPGCNCEVARGASSPLGAVGTLAAVGVLANRVLRSEPSIEPSDRSCQPQGEACRGSSSTPSRESKDT